jgi:hypothetical protein
MKNSRTMPNCNLQQKIGVIMKKSMVSAALFSLILGAGTVSVAALTDVEELGKRIYESPLLSLNQTQSWPPTSAQPR